jgi:hypothetical protein
MPMKGSRGTALPTLNFSTKSYGGQRHALAVLPQGKNSRYPLYKLLEWVSGAVGWGRKIQPPPGIEHRSVQPTRNMRGAYIKLHLHLLLIIHVNYHSKGNFRPAQAMKAQKSSRGTAVLFLYPRC